MAKTSKIILVTIIATSILLGLGYAAIQNITLNITGTASADPNQVNFKVMFTGTPEVSDKACVIATIIDDINATINVSGLTKKGDVASATYAVQNLSEDLSADLSVVTSNSNTEFFTVKSELANGKRSLLAGEATTLTVTVELIKTPLAESVSSTVGVQITSSPVQPGEEGTSIREGWTIPEGGTYIMANAADKTVYTEGEHLPYGYESVEGDIYQQGNYEYCYQNGWCTNCNVWSMTNGCECYIGDFNWTVHCINDIASPGPIVESINDSLVNCMDYAFYGCTSLTEAPVIPDSVTYMIDTFYGCTSLVTVPIIPNGVTNMWNTFYDCTSLTIAPVIPDSVTIMYGTFYGCTSLTTAPVIPDSVFDIRYTFYDCTSLTTAPIIPDGVMWMEETFKGCKSLKKYEGAPDGIVDGDFSGYVIPNGVTNMYNTFSGCTALTTAPVIPDSVTDMWSTFSDCTSLITAPVIPNSVINMGNTFWGCTSLITAPVIPNSVTDMSHTFYGCTSLTTAPVIPDGVTYIQLIFGECKSLKTYEGAPDGTEEGDFSGYVIPTNITDIGGLFSGCASLTKAPIIPDGVTNMWNTFSGCTSLMTAPVIPDGVIDMSCTFYGCTTLTTAPVIPSSVINMFYTFMYCPALEGTIEINANPETYIDCFYLDSPTDSIITLTGESTMLKELAETCWSRTILDINGNRLN